MFQFIRSIKGPEFLVIYFIYSFFITLLSFLFLKASNVRYPLSPNKYKINAYHLTVLNHHGNIPHLLETILFKLWIEKYLDISIVSGKLSINKTEKPIDDLLHEELEVYNSIKNSSDYTDIITTKQIKTIIKNFSYKLENELIYSGVLKSEKHLNHETLVLVISYVMMISLGAVKLFMGIANNKPVAFLILLMVLFSVVFFKIHKTSEFTKKGKDFVDRMHSKCSWLAYYNNSTGYKGDVNDVIIAVSLFGLSAVSGIPNFGMFSKISPPKRVDYFDITDKDSDSFFHGCSSCGGFGGGCGGCGGD
ncbi:UNVERIFIED_CONTAM: uncharacterized protein (TIGR04222 family) [Acetivibrio alkalicellulosi]